MTYGLYNGTSGKLLATLLAGKADNTIISQYEVEAKLNDITENIFLSGDPSFEKGVLGLGWLIEYLSQEKYIHINTNEVLENIDDYFYTYILNTVHHINIPLKEWLFLWDYEFIRYRNKYAVAEPYRKFTHFECLKLIKKIITQDIQADESKEIDKINEVARVLIKFSYTTAIDAAFEEMIEEYLYAEMEALMVSVSQINLQLSLLPKKYIYSLYESVLILLLAAKQYNNPHWITRFSQQCAAIEKHLLGADQPLIQSQFTFVLKEVYNNSTINRLQFGHLIAEPNGQAILLFLLSNYKDFRIIS